MSRWAVSTSDQGAVYLGYRLGHIKNDGRILRALVYNKGAMVLHMLRRLVGDEVFFRGLRRFYDSYRFQKAGTDELREVFEAESGQPLSRFFEEWIYGSDLPAVTVTWRVEASGTGQVAVVRVEQHGRLFDFPLTVSLQLADGTVQDALVRVTDRVVEHPVSVHRQAARRGGEPRSGGAAEGRELSDRDCSLQRQLSPVGPTGARMPRTSGRRCAVGWAAPAGTRTRAICRQGR